MIRVTDEPIDPSAVLQSTRCPAAGAAVLFLGTVRKESHGRKTVSLNYECYREMASTKLAELATKAQGRWQLTACAIVHRLGRLPVGEISVAVAVSAAHRRAAFHAGQWLIDRIKQVVPIWKQETYADGSSQWVHPGYSDGETKEA